MWGSYLPHTSETLGGTAELTHRDPKACGPSEDTTNIDDEVQLAFTSERHTAECTATDCGEQGVASEELCFVHDSGLS